MLKQSIYSIIFLFILIIEAQSFCINDSIGHSIRSTSIKYVSNPDNRNFNHLSIPQSPVETDPIIIPDQLLADSTQYHRNKALEYEQEVNSKNALIHNLNAISFLKLPVGLQRTIGSLNYTVIISRVEATPKGTFFEAYLMLELPQTGDKIAFRGVNIPFSNAGGFTGTGRLELIGSYPIAINDKTLFTILGRGNSFVEFDCNGFKGIGLDAQIEFSRDLLLPEDERGNVKPAPARATGMC